MISALLLIAANAISVPAFEIYPWGTVTGGGHNGEREWLLVDGITRRLHPTASSFGLQYGDRVRMACTHGDCWVWEFERKER